MLDHQRLVLHKHKIRCKGYASLTAWYPLNTTISTLECIAMKCMVLSICSWLYLYSMNSIPPRCSATLNSTAIFGCPGSPLPSSKEGRQKLLEVKVLWTALLGRPAVLLLSLSRFLALACLSRRKIIQEVKSADFASRWRSAGLARALTD